ncbi:MAG TPA: acyltransferase family protein [Stellaceae bacterium]|jgi:peptidoglycan/LPS O-acetylase OafA/YrhL|nr:acyltransferase family protein [Stellaceae bacterium]
MRYRADIDGLRAVAVLPVVAFHFGLDRVAPGGYVGVDIFFVISGFLITRIIYDDISAGTYSIAAFYERRIRRIFPALFVMFAACFIGSFFLYFPSEVTATGKGIISSVFFVSNIFFYSIGSYFDDNLKANPVLHTWSLSVEEQFYVLFPILMVLLQRVARRRQREVLAATALISFAASAVQVASEPSAAFYLVYFRAWELLIGGLVAIGLFPETTRRWISEGIAALGIAAIALAVECYDSSTPFPGIAALLPCLGAAAILYAGAQQQTFVSSVLAIRPMRFFGLISYSLYLWHWPLFVFYTSVENPGRIAKLGLVAAAIILATASWWFVERPFRIQPYRYGRRSVLRLGGAVMAVTACVAAVLGVIDQRFWPLSPAAAKFVEYEHYDAEQPMRVGSCFLTSEFNAFADFQLDPCLRVLPDKRNVLILGDSHAAHLWSGYAAVYPDVNFLQATASGCIPLEHPVGEQRCTDLVNYVFDKFLPSHHLDTILLSARWKDSDVPAAIATAAELRKYATQIVISGPIEEYDEALPRVLGRAAERRRNLPAYAAKHLRAEPEIVDRSFAAAKLPEGVRYVSVYEALCTPGCRLTAPDGAPLQFDYGHLTADGSAFLARKTGPLFLAHGVGAGPDGSRVQRPEAQRR